MGGEGGGGDLVVLFLPEPPPVSRGNKARGRPPFPENNMLTLSLDPWTIHFPQSKARKVCV